MIFLKHFPPFSSFLQVFSDLRAVYSGMVRHNLYQVQRVPELVGESGSMLIHFYSDVAYNMTGFNITFR